VRLVQFTAQLVRYHLKASAESLSVEDNLRVFQLASTLKPPLAVSIAHNLAYRIVKQQLFDGLQKRYEEIQVVTPNRTSRATMNPNSATEYRNLPLNVLIPSKTNPRRIIEDDSLRELAESISVHGVLEPLIVRPVTERDFEVVVGGRRFAASKKAGKDDAPCSIRNLTDAQVLEIQLVENLQRRDVHPLEEAQGFHAPLSSSRLSISALP
jgi:hypothetical protein